MSLIFEECLQRICKENERPFDDREILAKDAQMIRNHLIEKMKENNSQFKSAFDGLCLTGSYFDGLNVDLPEKFELHFKLKLPFKITPRSDKRRPGYVKLTTDQSRDHPIIEKCGKISRYALQMWIRSILESSIGEGVRLQSEERCYQVQYPKIGRGRGVAHTIHAIEVGAKGRTISFDFVPVFEFSRENWPFVSNKTEIPSDMRFWYAIPIGNVIDDQNDTSNSYVFMVCSPQTDLLAAVNELPHLKYALCLLNAIRNANGFQHITSYMLKSIFLHEFDEHNVDFWKQPTGEILIKLLESLAEDLHEQRLPFLLHKGTNLLDRTTGKIATAYKVKVERALRKLKNFRELQEVDYTEMLAIFKK